MKFVFVIVCCFLMSGCHFSAMAQQAPKDWRFEVGATATEAREQWSKLTTGEELARGKKVEFSPPPNYQLTTDENDAYDLTDGTLSTRVDDRVWLNTDAVGWHWAVITTSGVVMIIDLGQEQPVGQIAARVLGGKEQGGLILPEAIEFLASTDGEQFHSLHKLTKIDPAKKQETDAQTGFFIPEEGKAFMAPLVHREAVKARYIALRVMPRFRASLYVDQISVLKAPDAAPVKNLESFPKAEGYLKGLALEPRHSPFVVSTNILTPNWLKVLNHSGVELAKSNSGFRLELPEGLRILSQSEPPFKEVASAKPGIKNYEFTFTRNQGYFGQVELPIVEGPIWIEKDPVVTIPANSTVKITGILQGKDSHSVTLPLQLATIPEVPALKNFEISLGWIGDSAQQNWPNYLRDIRKFGFNYISTFPRWFQKDINGKRSADTQKHLDFLQQARKQGYGILYMESPFHVMWSNIQKAQQAGEINEAEAQEIYTQLDGKRGQHMNILYRGKYFQDEIKRIAELAALVQPTHVYYDIEWWDNSTAESKKDPRVIAAWKQSGKEWDDFATDVGTEVLRTLVTTMRQAVPQKKMVVGTYDSDPGNNINNSVLQFDKLYPDILDIAQPYLYVQGRLPVIADRIRVGYDAMQTRQIIPWLTAGTYGEFEPKRMEPMVLETILNGARGMTYFHFSDFEPMDFYYHSKALATLSPFEPLLQSGKPIAYKGDNPNLRYTAFASENEALVLVGNYGGSTNTKVNLPLPLKSAKQATLDGKPLAINGNSIALNVPPGEFRLIFISRK